MVAAMRDAPLSATLSIVFVAITTGAVSYVTLAYALARGTSAGADLGRAVPGAAARRSLISWALLDKAPAGPRGGRRRAGPGRRRAQPATIRRCARSIATPPCAAAPTPTRSSTAILVILAGRSRPIGSDARRSGPRGRARTYLWNPYRPSSANSTSPPRRTSSGSACS